MVDKSTSHSVTIKDIAVHLGLTHATVSRALSDHPHTSAQTKVRVREAAAALGYVPHLPARLMRQQTSTLFGLLVPDIENQFYGRAARSMADVLTSAGMQLMLALSDDDPETQHKQVLALRGARVAGIAVTLAPNTLPETLALLAGVPAVQILRRYRGGPKSSVVMDESSGVCEATEHLLALGHRRIAYIGSPINLSTGTARMRGFSLAHERRGLPIREELIRIGTPIPAFGREAATELLQRRQAPTALVLASPLLTIGAMDIIHRLGLKVPSELSVISHGDADWFLAADPAISAIHLPIEAVVRNAASTLLSHLGASTNPGREHISAPKLILRGTTAKPARRSGSER